MLLKRKWLKQILATLSMLRRNLKTNCIQTKDLAYRALVRPQLEYASVVWSPWQQGLSASIEKVQRCSARFVMNDYQVFPT